MSDLFSAAGLDRDAPRPLADRLRPARLEDVVGQAHLLAAEAPIGRMLKQKRLASMILWGPPGVGKTTIARLLAAEAGLEFQQISAVFSGVADLKKAFEAARVRRTAGAGTLLFVDEIHRFNRAQQDGFLPYVEEGIVTLVGAINIPIIKFSVDWWNTLHQPASVLRLDGPTIHPSMLWPLLVMGLAAGLGFATLMVLRMRTELMERRLRRLALNAAREHL
jgi:hypothetical protein